MNSKLVEIFLEVIAIEGLSGNEKPVGDYIRKFCAQYGLTVKEDDTHKRFGGNSGNLICRIGKGGSHALLAHMDTARSTKNVKPVVTRDRITSDGTSVLGVDNRVGVAVLLYTISQIFDKYDTPPDVTLAFTICEETTMVGSKQINLDPVEMAFIFDSALRPGNFICQSYGSQRFDVKITGKAAHSGLAPEKGINAIKIAAGAINEIDTGLVEDQTTVNIATIKGGQALNIVPDQVIIEGEVRSLTPARVLKKVDDIKSYFKKAVLNNGSTMEFSSAWEFEPYKITEDFPIYHQAVTAIKTAGLTPVKAISPGGSDANYLNAKGISALNLGIGAQNPHSNDEFILMEDLDSSARIAWALATSGN
jgi:tripeptide aminopeptidase